MTPLPTTGTLTFLFTDIGGSTRRWAEHPEVMSGALLRHDELLREAVERHGGGVFKHTGEACQPCSPRRTTPWPRPSPPSGPW